MEQRDSLTVLVVTRNHEDYIAAALDSIQMQDDVRIDRLVVSDDCSSDGTLSSVRSTLERLHMPAEVLESAQQMGIARHYQMLFSRLETDLVAVLEGDDYWCDRLKLNRQVSLLRAYPFASACALGSLTYREATKSFDSRGFGTSELTILGTERVIWGAGLDTFSNMMYRVDRLRRIPEEFYLAESFGDTIVNVLVSRQGSLIRLDTPGVVHRVSQNGAWEGLSPDAQRQAIVDGIEAWLPHLDEYSAHIFEAVLAQLKREQRDAAMPRLIRLGSKVMRRARSTLGRIARV